MSAMVLEPASTPVAAARGTWVDCHSHLLPGVDDGPRTTEQAAAMLADAARGGTRLLFVTPHLDHRFPLSPARMDLLEESFSRLVGLAETIPGAPELRLGYEVAPRPDSPESTADPGRFALPGTDVVLVDGPDDDLLPHEAGIADYVARVHAHGLQPVLAHPERHAVRHPDDHAFALRMKDAGALLQVDSGAFFGVDGQAAQTEAHRLLAEGLIDIIASDAHEAGEADLNPVHALIRQRLGLPGDHLLDGTAWESR